MPTNPQAQEDSLRPLLKTLLDVQDAFSLAEREIRRAQEATPILRNEVARTGRADLREVLEIAEEVVRSTRG